MPAKQRKIAIMGYRSVGKLNNALLKPKLRRTQAINILTQLQLIQDPVFNNTFKLAWAVGIIHLDSLSKAKFY